MSGRKLAIPLIAIGALWGASSLAQAADPVTLWNFLGIPQGIRKIQGATINRRGNFPGLERKPPLKALADPRNLESKNPAIKKAAEIKTEEDLAKQKIKALKYLATIGCGCYPGVKEALLAALDDCTEKVRYQAALAIGEAASNHCQTCNRDCCCDEEMTKRLAEVAYERDDTGCWLEPSERVREAAKEAMCACCRSKPDLGGWPIDAEIPTEVPSEEFPDTTPSGELPDTSPGGEFPNNDPPPPPPSPEARYETPAMIFSSANSKAPAAAAPRRGASREVLLPKRVPTARPVATASTVATLKVAAKSESIADKVNSYRSKQQQIAPAPKQARLNPAAGEQAPLETAAVEDDLPAEAPAAEKASPLQIAEAIAVLEATPTDFEPAVDNLVASEVDDPTATDDEAIPAEPAMVQAIAKPLSRPAPRYALVTGISEPQPASVARRLQPVVRPVVPVTR